MLKKHKTHFFFASVLLLFLMFLCTFGLGLQLYKTTPVSLQTELEVFSPEGNTRMISMSTHTLAEIKEGDLCKNICDLENDIVGKENNQAVREALLLVFGIPVLCFVVLFGFGMPLLFWGFLYKE